MCPQQYFIEYVLGIRSPSNKKADKGTIVHKVLEILACIKLAEQNSETKIVDDVVGPINIKKYNLNTLIEKVYNYYTSQFTHHEWELKDYKDCHSWVHKALDYNGGMFDPRNRNILQPEQHFDIEIKRKWAKFKYDYQGQTLEGNLAIKGTIDLITKVDDNTIEIIDWKTGRRLDWATGEEKTPEKLQKDPQLKIYHYAVSQLYPDIKHVMITINFINDGGPFTICYDDSDLISTENMLKEKFETIKQTQIPQLNKSWKCTKLCHFGKTTFDSTHIHPISEYRDNQLTPVDKLMTKCEQIKHDIEIKGIDTVVDEYTIPGYAIGKYKAPGSTE
jgi:ATP-dependent helicase/DNAse subunit B